MRRLSDFDEYSQAKPKNKPLSGSGSQIQRDANYVTVTEFEDMQTELKNQLAEQVTLLAQILSELRQSKAHLASLSGEQVEPEDVEEE